VKSIIDPYKTIGIIGLAKNTGKTTSLNAILSFYQSIPIAITSIGLDGEDYDQVNYLPKPKIRITKNMIVATAKKCLDAVDTPYETIETTNLKTALGVIKIVRFKAETHVVVAGPTTNKDLNTLINTLKKYADKIFIDGAFNRKTFANIEHIDAIVLATGANVASSMEETIEVTKRIDEHFKFERVKGFNPIAKIMLQTEKKDLYIPHKNIEDFSRVLERLDTPLKALYIEGAITENFINKLLKSNEKNYHLIIDDPTKIIAKPKTLDYLKKYGVNISVRKTIPLIAITINPTQPSGENYSSSQFLTEIKKAIDTPIFDVMRME
jgi:hypothetical protein